MKTRVTSKSPLIPSFPRKRESRVIEVTGFPTLRNWCCCVMLIKSPGQDILWDYPQIEVRHGGYSYRV